MISRLGIILVISALCTGCHTYSGNMQPCKRIKSQLGSYPGYQMSPVGTPGAPAPGYSKAYQAKMLQEYQQYDCEDR